MNGRIGHMATLVSDPLPEAEQHAVRGQHLIQESSLGTVRLALGSLESPQVAVVDHGPGRKSPQAQPA